MIILTIDGTHFQGIHQLHLDYLPYLKIIEKIANGKWLEENNWKNTLNKAHVPWSVFQFEETKTVLKNVKWEIRAEANERENFWGQLEGLLRKREIERFPDAPCPFRDRRERGTLLIFFTFAARFTKT